MLRNQIYDILKETPKEGLTMKVFSEIRSKVIELMLKEFYLYAGEDMKPMFIKKAFYRINTEWIEAVKFTKKDGIIIYKENGFNNIMKGVIKKDDRLKVLTEHVNFKG